MSYGNKIDRVINLLQKINIAYDSYLKNYVVPKAAGDDSPDNELLLSDEMVNLFDMDNKIKLDSTLKNQFEHAFGTDLSSVNIHTGIYAENLTRSANAQAITIGKDIYFAKGKFSPETEDGIKLLAHEIQHVVQNLNNKRLAYNEDIAHAEHEAEKVEEALGEMRLHNIKDPLLDQSEIPGNSSNQNSQENYVALHKSNGSSDAGSSLEDFTNSNKETMFEIITKDGTKVLLTKKEINAIYTKFESKLSNWIEELKFHSSNEEYIHKLTNFKKIINV